HPTETSCYADILLPGTLWAEAEGTMVNSERNVTLMQTAVAPPGDALPDWEILAQAARHFGFAGNFNYKNAGDVFAEISETSNPKTGYDLRGISYDKLRRQSRQWPCAPDGKNGKAIRYLNPDSEKSAAAPKIIFPTDSGKARLF